MPKLLGIDPGRRRVGLAITDETGTITRPLTTIDREEVDLADQLADLVKNQSVDRIIVGYPDPLKTNENERTRQVDNFIETFVQSLPVPHKTVSERYTTKQADELRKHRGDASEHPPDAEAAALILDHYLGTERKHDFPSPEDDA